MPYNVLVSKIRALDPNKKSTPTRNRNNLIYITTREGTDLSPLNKELQFNDDAADNSTYLKYITERPRSHGGFGNIPTDDLDSLSKQLYQMSKNKTIYRGIVSLDSRDAIELGFTDKNSWNTFLRASLPDVAKEFNIPIDKLQWVGAFHMEPDHPHVHYMFWNKDNHVQSTFIHPSKQSRCRELFSAKMFQAERQQAIINQTIYRDLVMDLGKSSLSETLEEIFQLHVPGETKKVMPNHVSTTEINVIAEKLLELLPNLPDQGRLNYQFMPQNVKEQIDSIVEYMLETPEIKKAYTTFKKHTDTISETYSVTDETGKKKTRNSEKRTDDLKKRLANCVLKTSKELLKADIYEIKLEPSSSSIIPEELPTLEFPEIDDEIKYYFPDSGYLQEYIDDLSVQEQMNEYYDTINTSAIHDDSLTDDIPDFIYDNDFKRSNTPLQKYPSSSQNFYLSWSTAYKQATSALYDAKDFKKALNLFNAEHLNGNILASLEMAKMHEHGLADTSEPEIASSLYSDSLYHLEELFSNPGPDTNTNYIAYRIGKIYESGKGTKPDISKAIFYFQNSSNKFARYLLGKIYLKEYQTDNEKKDAIIPLFTSSAEAGNPYASFELGKIYENGILCSIDRDLSRQNFAYALAGFLKNSSDWQDDNLMYRIAKMYETGKGNEKDMEKAIKYYKKSASLHNPNALYSLGIIYMGSNNSTLFNIELALNCLKESAELNNSFAQYQLGRLFFNGELVQKNIDKALDFLKISANQDNEFAQYFLGKIYSDPDSKLYDINIAIEWLEKSSNHNNQYAQFQLGILYYTGDLVKKDIDMALKLLQSPADQNNNFAQYFLGKIYADPESAFFNMNTALNWYMKAAEQNNSFAQYQLGKIYLFGNGIPKNEELGKQWLNKSIQEGNEYAKQLLQFYDNMKLSKTISFSYRLFLDFFQAISDENHDHNKANPDHAFTNQSKKKQKKKDASQDSIL